MHHSQMSFLKTIPLSGGQRCLLVESPLRPGEPGELHTPQPRCQGLPRVGRPPPPHLPPFPRRQLQGDSLSLCRSSWLLEGVEREKAEELLSLPGNRVGSFMVRESTRERGEKGQKRSRRGASIIRFTVGDGEMILCDGARRCVLAVGEAQEHKALPDLQAGQQLVLHLPQPHLPVLGGLDQPLLWCVEEARLF